MPRGFSSQCLMPSARVIKAVDILEDSRLHLPTHFPRPAPDQLGLDGLEEGFDDCVVIEVTFSAHRRLEPVLTLDLLVVVGEVLAVAVAVEDATSRWGSHTSAL